MESAFIEGQFQAGFEFGVSTKADFLCMYGIFLNYHHIQQYIWHHATTDEPDMGFCCAFHKCIVILSKGDEHSDQTAHTIGCYVFRIVYVVFRSANIILHFLI